MSAICAILRESFDDYAADRLPAPQRRILREHLAACEGCREAAMAKDASFLFARPFVEGVAPGETAAILAAVRTGVAHIETERRLTGAGRRGSKVAAAAAAVAVLALTVAGGSARRQVAVAALPAAAPTPAPALEPADAAVERAALPAEPLAPSNATVYDLNPGAGREEPRVVWIVDRGLDI